MGWLLNARAFQHHGIHLSRHHMLKQAKVAWLCVAGLAAMAGYEVFHVLPKWRFLVTRPMQTSGSTAGQAIGWLAAFGAVYNCHR